VAAALPPKARAFPKDLLPRKPNPPPAKEKGPAFGGVGGGGKGTELLFPLFPLSRFFSNDPPRVAGWGTLVICPVFFLFRPGSTPFSRPRFSPGSTRFKVGRGKVGGCPPPAAKGFFPRIQAPWRSSQLHPWLFVRCIISWSEFPFRQKKKKRQSKAQ